MGFYNDGKIYGVQLTILDENEDVVKEWEKKSSTKLQIQEIQEIKEEYNKLNEHEKNHCSIMFYTCCSDTYCDGTYMMWVSGYKKQLEELFEKGDIII